MHFYGLKIPKARAEQTLVSQDQTIGELRKERSLIVRGIEAVLRNHMPTLREARIDVTTVPVEEIRDRITDKINENMFCTGCKYRWPCEQFKQLLTLKDMAYGYVDLEKSVEDLEKINPNFTLTPKTLHL